MHNVLQKHDHNLWGGGGALFVGAPGQLPTLPSPKSGPVYIYTQAKNTLKMSMINDYIFNSIFFLLLIPGQNCSTV